MRALRDMDTIQIEITNACINQCSNCTRLVGHHPKPYFMPLEKVKEAIDSLKDYPKMTGIMGGEPLFHPQFPEICAYLGSMIPPEKCGLWTCFPKGKEHYREIICKTFGNIFLNDHSRDDILHGPVLVSSAELCGKDTNSLWYLVEHCWVQNGWSACINENGAFFCEVAGALDTLFNKGKGWKVEPEWWEKIPKDFKEQMETYCVLCGCAMPLERRASTEGIDDISPGIFEMIKDTSPKIKQGKYVIHDFKCVMDQRPTATYKNEKYRAGIADRYGIFLMRNKLGFQTPYLRRAGTHVNQDDTQGKYDGGTSSWPDSFRNRNQSSQGMGVSDLNW